jgi:hypothetical protein
MLNPKFQYYAANEVDLGAFAAAGRASQSTPEMNAITQRHVIKMRRVGMACAVYLDTSNHTFRRNSI